MATRISPIGLKKHLDRTYNITDNARLRVLLIRSGNNVAANILTAATLADISTLNECRDATYAAVTPTGIAFDDSGTNTVDILCDEMEFTNTGDHSADSIVGCLVCIYTGSTQSAWIPLAWHEFSTATTLDGTTEPLDFAENKLATFSYTVNNGGRPFSSGVMALLNQTINPTTANKVKALLVTADTTAMAGDAANPADITLGETDDGGYSRQSLTSVAWTISSNVVALDAADTSWAMDGDATDPITKLLHVLSVDGTDANDLLLSCQPLKREWTPAAGTRDLRFPATGLLKFTL